MGEFKLRLDVGQATNLKHAFARNGWSNREIDRLCEGKVLADVLDYLRGDARLKKIHHHIESELEEFPWEIIRHVTYPRFPWGEELIDAISCPNVVECVRADGDLAQYNPDKMMPEFVTDYDPLNICYRDFLFEKQHLIPCSWSDLNEPILFWGTLYEKDGKLYVPGLDVANEKGDQWFKLEREIRYSETRLWGDHDPYHDTAAAVLNN